MKHTSAQIQFFASIFLWLAVLQIIALWYINTAGTFICNSGGAWPLSLSGVSFLENGILTLIVTVILAWWAWQTLGTGGQKKRNQAYSWALVVATGISHTIERLSSQCILDYWQITLWGKNIHFNLGDISLTLGIVLLVGLWWSQNSKNHR